MNRDERRQRREPGVVYQGNGLLFPVDAQSQGTWFGLDERGWVMALLNRYEQPSAAQRRSRGELIPRALSSDSPVNWLCELDPAQWNPFDLFCIHGRHVWHIQWDGEGSRKAYTCKEKTLGNGFMICSSSLFGQEVLDYRQQLFNDWMEASSGKEVDTLAASVFTDFHQYQAQGMAMQAVRMERELSHTKSICQARADSTPPVFSYLHLETGILKSDLSP